MHSYLVMSVYKGDNCYIKIHSWVCIVSIVFNAAFIVFPLSDVFKEIVKSNCYTSHILFVQWLTGVYTIRNDNADDKNIARVTEDAEGKCGYKHLYWH